MLAKNAAGEGTASAAPQDQSRPAKPPLKRIYGLIHTPPTPYTADNRVDGDTFQKLADFLVRHGADSSRTQCMWAKGFV